MRRLLLLLATTAGVLAGLAVLFWPSPRSHLLLITLDTTRADRLGSYGYAAGRTPVLDALARAGVQCDRAYTVAPLTLPAHTSLLTGLYPTETGVRRNGRERLGVEIPTLAEILKGEGYETGAFVASFVLDSKFGLDRGFNHYDDGFGADAPAGNSENRRRNGSAVVDAALAWLGKLRSRPFFCWVHFYDPHAPCVPHRDLFAAEFAERPYDGEIAYVDQQVGRLVDFLKARQLDAQTLVVVVGDHGEGLGEHFEQTHSLTLYNTTLHVPLIFCQPEKLAPGGRVATNVSMVDIFPTILELLGQRPTETIAGKSIAPALRGGAAADSACYGATDDPFDVYGCAPLRSLTERDWKYIRSTRVELFDLANDPGERTNLAELEPEKAQEMESRLGEFEAQLVSREETRVRLSADDRRALAGLGYVGAAPETAARSATGKLPDIKDILPLEADMEEAVKLFSSGSAETAIKRLREIIRQAPTHAPASWSLAWALWKQGKTDEGMDVFRSLLIVRPDCHTAHYGLGFMLLQRDRFDEAIPEFLKAIEADPEYTEAHFHLAEALFVTGRIDEAKAHSNMVLETDPGHVGAIQLRTFIQANLGRIDAAAAEYRQALQRASEASRDAEASPSDGRSNRP